MIILLLDIDGVLVKPGGYRKALMETIPHFAETLGFGSWQPQEEEVAFCESLGITNEWDIIPIFLAAMIEEALKFCPDLMLPADWTGTHKVLAETHCQAEGIDYRGYITLAKGRLLDGHSPSLSILENRSGKPAPVPFPLLSRQPFIETLFRSNKDIEKSKTSNYFQNLVLGSKQFSETYHLPSPMTSPSYLLKYDKTLLVPYYSQAIKKGIQAGYLKPVAYSARPSLPPREIKTESNTYSPEAEMAMDLVGLKGVPLIAYGRLAYLAQAYRLPIDWLMKPSPFQALAAILAAISSNELVALKIALPLAAQAGLIQFEGAPDGHEIDMKSWAKTLHDEKVEVHIIEDSPIGLPAGQKACALLSGLGLPVELSLWGVADQEIKKKALEACGARVFPNINDILKNILE